MVTDDNSKPRDVEEGEIPDPALAKGIGEDDVRKGVEASSDDSKIISVGGVGDGGKDFKGSKIWTLRDQLHKFSRFRSTVTTGLNSIACAQAVQNKPLDKFLVLDVDDSGSAASANSSKDGSRIVIDISEDDEKEEGELEEGEIDTHMDPPPLPPLDSAVEDLKVDVASHVEDDLKEKELEKQVIPVLEVLESITVNETEKFFEKVCTSLQSTLNRLRELVLANESVPKKDTLVQLSLAAVQTIFSVFTSMNQSLKEQNLETLSRLLLLVKSYEPPLFSPHYMTQIESMAQTLKSSAAVPSPITGDVGHDAHKLCGVGESFVDKKQNHSIKSRLPLIPLLDLHKDHDMDSLPSPTRESKPCFHAKRPVAVEEGFVKPSFAISNVGGGKEDTKRHPYETDALKAVSSYHLKFGRASHIQNNRLLSPTPSEESGNGDGDVGDDASSSPSFGNLKHLHPGHPVMSQGLDTARIPTPMTLVSNLPVKGLKSRDPRLRSASTDPAELNLNQNVMHTGPNTAAVVSAVSLASSRKQKSVDECLNNSPPLKRQKSEANEPTDVLSGLGIMKPSLDIPNPESTTLSDGVICSRPNTAAVVSSVSLASSRKQKSVDECLNNSPPLKRQKSEANEPTDVLSGLGIMKPSLDIPNPESTTRSDGVICSRPNTAAVVSAVSLASSRKQKSVDECLNNSPPLKRQKSEANEPTDVLSGLGIMKPSLDIPNPESTTLSDGVICSNGPEEPVSVSGASATVSLQPLLKDISPVDATMLLNILQTGDRQKLAEVMGTLVSFRKTGAQPPSIKSGQQAVSSLSLSPSGPGGILSNKEETTKVPCHNAPLDEATKFRFKPRDPRRLLLQGSTLQRTRSGVQEQLKANAQPLPGPQDNKDKLVRNVETKPARPLSAQPPNIVQQFTSNMKTMADLLTVSQCVSTPIVTQNPPSQPVQIKVGRDIKTDSLKSEDKSAVGASGPSGSTSKWGDVEHLFEGYDDKQRTAIQKERARRIEEQNKMFAARKLCLVLDLDHTLLNSAKFHEVDPMHDEILRRKEEQDRENPYRHLYRLSHMGMWTKLRPGVWNFLEKASKLFELHLYTMGNKLYATEMAKILDPKGVLFNGRVISRGDDGDLVDGEERVPKSKDLEGVLGMESAVVIVDDSVRVWPHNKMNLIVVERYMYFPCSRRQFGLSGASLLEIDHDERSANGSLASSLAVMERIHQNFFSHSSLEDVDVRNILASEQQKILAGCRIVFSRVFPVGEAKPHLHPLWQTAEQFGAVCTMKLDEHVTHVVANSLGTDKVKWAQSCGKFVVYPGWVEASSLLYRRANEKDFTIKP